MNEFENKTNDNKEVQDVNFVLINENNEDNEELVGTTPTVTNSEHIVTTEANNFNGEAHYTAPTMEVNSVKSKKQKKGKGKKVFSYVATGLACALIGGVITTGASLYLLPKTSFFKNSPLYQSMYRNSSIGGTVTPVKFAETPGALTVPEIAKKVGPAVVGVATKSITQSGIFGGSKSQEGIGSGIIFSSDGYILTNYHVIDGAQKITIIFNDGKQANAKIVNFNKDMDVAVVKVTDNIPMPAVAEFGDSSKLQAGDPVVAIGNPLGKEFLGSVTSGIISSTHREIDQNSKRYLLQTDAAINPGNSGGPLINAYGQVIGVNSAKISSGSVQTESSIEGIGLSIPIDEIKPLMPDLETQMKKQLMLGISISDLTQDQADQYNVPVGVLVQSVTDLSPAFKAGLQRGDIITKFDGTKVTTGAQLNDIKAKKKAGDSVKIEIWRDGRTQTLTLKLTDQ